MSLIANIIYYVVPFIILLGILVFVHEFGHFIVARMLGVRVVAFSIGFGKKLWSKTDSKGTNWQIAAVPLGGYCQFLGDADASSSTVDKKLSELSANEKKEAFALQKTWKKILIVIAGPLFNYLFAALIFIGIFWLYGKMVYPPIVGEVMENSAAEKAGIAAGDTIISVDGKKVTDFMNLSNEIQLAKDMPVKILVQRKKTIEVLPEICEVCGNKSEHKIIGLSIQEQSEENDQALKIEHVLPDSPAQKAGLHKDDILLTVDGQELKSFTELQQYVASHQEQKIKLEYSRQILLEAYLEEADAGEEAGMPRRQMLGVKSVPELTVAEEYDFNEAFVAGIKETYDITAMTLRGVWQMITGKRSGEDVGGIIRIAELSGDVSKHGGLLGFFYFMALISVNLGLINLFPIPVLDGGNLVIFLIELCIGRELKPNIKDYIFKFGILIVLALMMYATWNDIMHLIGRIFR